MFLISFSKTFPFTSMSMMFPSKNGSSTQTCLKCLRKCTFQTYIGSNYAQRSAFNKPSLFLPTFQKPLFLEKLDLSCIRHESAQHCYFPLFSLPSKRTTLRTLRICGLPRALLRVPVWTSIQPILRQEPSERRPNSLFQGWIAPFPK